MSPACGEADTVLLEERKSLNGSRFEKRSAF